MIKFVGIERADRVGDYSVDKNARIMKRYRFIHEGLMRIAAGHLPARLNWHLKAGLGKHLYEDAEAANHFRKRILELRTSSATMDQQPDPVLSLMLDELIHAGNDLELTVGIYGVIKPALLQTYKKHIETTQQLVDQPSIRILRGIILDLEEQLKWGGEMIRFLVESGNYPEGCAEFQTNLEQLLSAAGGIDGSLAKSSEFPRRWRSHQPYKLPQQAARDPNMGPVTWARTSVANPPEDEIQKTVIASIRSRQEEMCAAELIAAVLYSQQNMPWEFYYDLARHLWDEVRHSLFGQAALEAEGYEWMSQPQYTSDYDINASKIPSSQYAWLSIGIEGGAMTQFKAEYQFYKDKSNNPLATQFIDYDWADEVVHHVHFGKRWSPEMAGDDLSVVQRLAKKELDHFWENVQKAQAEFDASRS